MLARYVLLKMSLNIGLFSTAASGWWLRWNPKTLHHWSVALLAALRQLAHSLMI
jgi:hypothetical protein